MPDSLVITICVTEEHTQCSLAQVARIQANLIHWKLEPGRIILSGDSSLAVKEAVRLYERLLPGWKTQHLIVLGKEYKRSSNHDDAMMVLARLRTEAFSEARIHDPDYVWSLDSDVLPPANALRSMYDMLQFDSGFYSVATCPYANIHAFIGGLGERNNPIYPSVYPDERKIPDKLLERKAELDAQATAYSGDSLDGVQHVHKEIAELNAEIAANINNYPAVGNVFARNAKGWKPRGWLDDCFPAIGKGGVVKIKWAGFGCNLINREALSHINWDGYAGGGTEDLYICYNRWEQAGLNICAIPHCLCDHVKVNPGRPEERIVVSTRHEVAGLMEGHCRTEFHPYYQFQSGEKRNPKFKAQFLPKIEKLPDNTPIAKLVDKAYEIGLLQVRKEVLLFIDWLKDKKIRRVLEIGTDRGGLLYLLLHLGVEHTTSIDLPNGPYGTKADPEWRNQAIDKAFPGKVRWIAGDSQDPKLMLDMDLSNSPSPQYYDLLIIDGDHTKALQDYKFYEKLVRDGGWVFLHDIKDTKVHRDQKVTVMDDWKVIRKEVSDEAGVELLDTTEEWGGIGILQIQR